MKIRIIVPGLRKKVTASLDCIEIETDQLIRIETDNPCANKERMENQLVMRNGWIECDWDKMTGFITDLEIVVGDPYVNPDRKIMDWIQTRNPLKG